MNYTLITAQQLYDLWNENIPEKSRIGLNTIYTLIKRKDFPSVRIGGKIYIIAEQVDAWLTKQQTSNQK